VAHQHYKGTGQMHSFRGLLVNGGQDKIRIEGATGEIAWRITKFQLIPQDPGGAGYESVVQIWREKQTTVIATIDFTDNELLAAGYLEGDSSRSDIDGIIVVFDNALFSRNIYVTHLDDDQAATIVNYYIELEEVKVSAAGMAQLAVAAARRT